MKKFGKKEIELHNLYINAVQSGVAFSVAKGEGDTSPKHLRTGVNLAMVEHAALTELLIEKGLITYEEFLTALVKKTREEEEKYEDNLSVVYGKKVTLG
jgi:hypothetical protein